MTADEIAQMQTENVLLGWSKQGGLNPTVVEHAEGIYIYDSEGNRYADMSSEQVNVNAGYANKEMTEAIKAQLDKYAYVQGSWGAEPRAKLAKSIIDRLPDCFGKVFFTNGGADANENAIKIARMYTGRFKVILPANRVTLLLSLLFRVLFTFADLTLIRKKLNLNLKMQNVNIMLKSSVNR